MLWFCDEVHGGAGAFVMGITTAGELFLKKCEINQQIRDVGIRPCDSTIEKYCGICRQKKTN